MSWVLQWKEPVEIRAQCIREHNDELFVAGALWNSGVAVLDAKTGKTKRGRMLPGGLNLGMPFVLTKELMLVPISDVGVWALERDSPGLELKWTHPAGAGICGVSVSGDAAYVSKWANPGSQDKGGGLARLCIGNGQVEWDKAIGAVGTMPTVANGKVCVGLVERGEWAVSTADGAPCWNQNPPRRVTNQGSATVHEGLLYFNDDDQPRKDAAVYALSISDGTPKWQTRLNGELPMTNLLLHQRSVFTATKSALYALDIDNNGAELWRTDLKKKGAWTPRWAGWLEVHQGLIHLHTEKGLRFFSVTDGNEEPRLKFSSSLLAYRIDGDHLYVGLGSKGGRKMQVAAYEWIE